MVEHGDGGGKENEYGRLEAKWPRTTHEVSGPNA